MLLKQALILILTFAFSTYSMVNTLRNNFETETQTSVSISAKEVVVDSTSAANTPEFISLSQADPPVAETHEQETTKQNLELFQNDHNSETIPVETQSEETICEETIPIETEFVYIEKFPEVPHYFQQDYNDIDYGNYGTVGDHGCGVTCVAMVLSYLLDEEILPDFLAENYGRYNTEVGSDWALFTQTAEDFGVTVKKIHHPWEDVVAALKNGQVVIANPHKESIFTDGGHFVVLYGITEEGKIFVHDPSRRNYREDSSIYLKEGFANGFDEKFLKYNCCPWWIYEVKNIDALAEKAKNELLHLPTQTENEISNS